MMTPEDREMLIETHTFCKMNHDALYGKEGLVEKQHKLEGAWKASTVIGGIVFAVIGLVITVLELT